MVEPRTTQPKIDFAAARAKVVERLALLNADGRHRCEIQDDLTHDHKDFWLFYWGVRSDLRPGQWASVGGNCPYAVRKSDGAVFAMGARYTLERFAEEMQSGELDRKGHRIA